MDGNNNTAVAEYENDGDAAANNRCSHIDPSIVDKCAKLVPIAMDEAFRCVPYSWQCRIVTHMNLMTTKSQYVIPSPIFLCAPTGGGKSLARDTFAACRGGVSICICPLLSLGADQVSKINAHSTNGDGSVRAHHLDAFKGPRIQQSLCDRILKITRQSETTLILMTSPQALIKIEIFYKMFLQLLIQKTLTLITVDELQLFVSFGLRFRPEFHALKEKVFPKLKASDDSDAPTNIPVLFMTATATNKILTQLQLLTGLSIKKENLFWPSARQLLQRKCYIHFDFSVRANMKLRDRINHLMSETKNDDVYRQFLVCANSRNRVDDIALFCKEHLDANGYPGDIITIVGTQSKEQKLEYTNLFLNPTTIGSNVTGGVVAFDPIGTCTTRSMGGAGWDNPNI